MLVRQVRYTDGLGDATADLFNSLYELRTFLGESFSKLIKSQKLWVQDIYSDEVIGKCQEYYENSHKTSFFLVKL